MKVLAICGAIRLPDDFNGSMADAWALLGDQVIGGTVKNRVEMTDEECTEAMTKKTRSGAGYFGRKAIQSYIDDMRPADGPKINSLVSFSELMPNGQWTNLNVNQNRHRLKVVRG